MLRKVMSVAFALRVRSRVFGLLLGALILVGVAVAAPATSLVRPWLGGAGGRSGGESIVLEAAIGQPAAGLAAGGGHRLCAGAACPDGDAVAPPTPARGHIYLPIARLDPRGTARVRTTVRHAAYQPGTFLGPAVYCMSRAAEHCPSERFSVRH